MRGHRTLNARATAVAAVIAAMVHVATLQADAMPLPAAAPAAPSGPSPASAATAVAISTSLTWAPSAEASTYDVAFGTTTSPPRVSAGQAATSYTPPAPLAYAKTYYWRITAKGPGGSTVGPLWSFTTVPAAPAMPSGPSPVDGASAVTTSTLLKWAASTRATSYDVALGTSNPPAVVSTGQTARSYTPPTPLAYTTTYYWQIAANGAGGTTTGPVWSFTTSPAPPARPSGPSPASAATAVPISTSLTWATSAGASTYDVAFGTTSSPPVVSAGQTTTSYTPPAALAYATKYYWRITARGPGGSTAGPLWSFKTIAAPPPPPAAPAGPSPASGSAGVAQSAGLTWAASAGASTYDVAFGTTSSPPVVSAGQAATSYTPPAALAYATTYYWQITAKGTGGSTAGPVWSFTTVAAPPAVPNGPSPANASIDIAPSTVLTWAASAGASTYDLAFGTSNPPSVVSTNQSTTTYTPSAALAYATTYYWQITAKGAGGSTGGPVWSFTTAAAPVPAPDVPSGPSPANASTDIAPSTALTWAASPGASTYDLAFGTSYPPSVVSTDQSTTTYTPSAALAYATTYYWQVTAKGTGGSTAGPLWSFTTAAAPVPAPDVPSAPSPANASTDIAPPAAITWAASPRASTYDVAFGTSNPPNVVSTDQSTTTYTPSAALAYATTYYWQITAKGAGGSTAGPVWSFTTIAAPPPTQTLDRLRLMTWNISMGKNLAGTMNVDEQVALMADSGAQIIALQEVTVSSAADLRAQYETKLEALTQRDWTAVWAPDPRPTPSEGNLILTMLPVLSSSIFQYDSAPWDPTWLDTKRSAAQISVSVNGVPVTVFATHLPLDANHRRSHINAMLTWVAGFAGPRIFGGDFNMVAGTTEYATMQGAFADAWTLLAPADQGFTMDKRSSAGNTPGRIDYWWQEITDTQARGTELWVIKTKRSDHHALVIDLDVHAK